MVNREEEQETMVQRGEMVKFLILVMVLVGAVFVIALLRPLIFERMVPSVLGWDQELEPPPSPPGITSPAGQDAGETQPVIMTATPPAGENAAGNGGAPLPTPRVHEVQAGETLATIAVRYGISVEALVKTNAISNPHRIQAGDVLVIPEP